MCRFAISIAIMSVLGSLLYFTSDLELSAIFKGINQYNEVLKAIAVEEKTGWGSLFQTWCGSHGRKFFAGCKTITKLTPVPTLLKLTLPHDL